MIMMMMVVVINCLIIIASGLLCMLAVRQSCVIFGVLSVLQNYAKYSTVNHWQESRGCNLDDGNVCTGFITHSDSTPQIDNAIQFYNTFVRK